MALSRGARYAAPSCCCLSHTLFRRPSLFGIQRVMAFITKTQFLMHGSSHTCAIARLREWLWLLVYNSYLNIWLLFTHCWCLIITHPMEIIKWKAKVCLKCSDGLLNVNSTNSLQFYKRNELFSYLTGHIYELKANSQVFHIVTGNFIC